MKQNKIFFEIKQIIKKFFFKIIFFFSKDYITHQDFLLNHFFCYKKKNSEYKNFLTKEIFYQKKYTSIEQNIILLLVTILFELSAHCSSNKVKIIIISNEINLRKINKNLKKILPTDTSFVIKKKIPKNFKKLIILNLSSIKILQNAINIFFKKNTKRIKVIDNSTKSKNDFPIFIKEIHEYKKLKKKFLKTKVSFNNIFYKIEFFKKIFKKYSLYYSEIISYKKNFVSKRKKFNLNYNNIIKIVSEKNAVLSFHGTISRNNFIINESRNLSLRDGYYNGFNVGSDMSTVPKVTKFINSSCVILPSTGSSIGHYFLESLSTLFLFKNLKKLKIIVDKNIPDYIFEILNYFGIKKSNVIKKDAFESWKIKKIIFPIYDNTRLLPLSLDIFKFFRINKNFKVKKNLKIYISRKDSKSSRILINEDRIIKKLVKKKYKICNFSKMNMLKKLKILSRAKVIVAPTGAGLFNLFFANIRNIKLFLISSKLYLPTEFIDLCYYKKLKLTIIRGQTIPSYSQWWGYDHSSLYLDEKLVEKLP